MFIPRDHRVTMYKKASGGEQYCGIYMCFTRSFLREMYGKYARHTNKAEHVERFVPGVMKLPPSAEIVCFDDTLLQSGSETAGRRDAPEVAGRIAGPASYR